MRAAVVGHVEWVTFARVPVMPSSGDIVHASEVWEEPGGGGGSAATAMLEVTGSCTLFTALGDDALGRHAAAMLRDAGIEVRAVHREITRRVFTHIDATGERTITVLGERLEPRGDDDLGWSDLDAFDAVYVAGADAAAIAQARRARVLVGTARILPALRTSGVRLDALVGSAGDPSEAYEPGALEHEPELVVRTEGREGGTVTTSDGGSSRYVAVAPSAAVVDTYGCGDRFAIALAVALAAGERDPASFAAARASEALTRRGVGLSGSA